jgi:hypothetical protein
MRKGLIAALVIAGVAVQAQNIGIRLNTLIELGAKLPYAQSFRRIVVGGDGESLVIPLHGYPERYESLSRMLILDLRTRQVQDVIDYGGSYDYYAVPISGTSDFYLFYYSQSRFSVETTVVFRYAYGSGLTKINYEDVQLEKATPDYRLEQLRIQYNYTNALGQKFYQFPTILPNDVDVSNEFVIRLILSSESAGNRDQELIQNKYACMVAIDLSSILASTPYEFRAFNNDLLFRIPFVMVPAANDDQGITGGEKIQLMQGGKQLMLSGHAYLHSMFPELEGKVKNQRRQFVWIYDIVDDEEWDKIRDRPANYILLKEDVSGIQEARPIKAERYSVKPGTRPYYGLYGELTEERINLRSGPSLQSSVIMLLTSENIYKRQFMILERSAEKERIGDQEEYWYKIKFDTPRGGSMGWVYGGYIKLIDQLKAGIEIVP